MQEEDNDSRKNEVVAHRAPSESVSDAPKLRTRKRPPKKLTISAERTLTSPPATGHGASSRKRSETGNLRLSTLTRQATLSPSRPRLEAASLSSGSLPGRGSGKQLRSLVGLTPKEMAVHVVEQREKREVAQVKSSFRNAVKLVRRRMSVRKSEENVLVKETKKATSAVNAKGVLETAKSSISWKVKALLGITALVGLCTVLAPVILPVAVTMLEMTFLTALQSTTNPTVRDRNCQLSSSGWGSS